MTNNHVPNPIESVKELPEKNRFITTVLKPDWSILTDNPIIIKQTRVRLKRSSMISWMMIVGVLASASIWMEYQFKTKRYDRSAGYMLGAMIFMMLIIGATQLALMINTTRSSGMIDFHRLSPQSPRSLLFGFMIGGPIREYAIVLFAIPFLVMACILYGTPLLGLIQILLAILMLTLVMHGMTIVSAMLAKNTNPNAAKGATWGIFAAMGMLGPIFSGTLAIDRLAGDPPMVYFFGVKANALMVFSGVAGIAVVFFMIAGVRRFQDDIRPSLTKRQAIMAMSLSILVGWGFMFHVNYFNNSYIYLAELIVIGIWAVLSFLLIATASPERVAYIGGLRRSLRLGLRRPSPFQDRALNRWVLLIFAGIVTIGIAGLYSIRNEENHKTLPLPGASTATAVLMVIEFGLAMQYYRLRIGKLAGGALALFLFVAWFMPFMLGMALSLVSNMPNENEGLGYVIMSISPVFGVPLGAGVVSITAPITECRLAALIPTLAAVFIFNQMITNLQRRIDRRIMPEHREPDADPFAWLDNSTPSELVARRIKSQP